MVNKITKVAGAGALFVFLFFTAERVGAMGRAIDPVVVAGAKLENLLGRPVEKIRVFSWKNGTWIPVPFQIDERMEVFVYRSILRQEMMLSYAFDSGLRARHDPDPFFDRDDELVFMAADGGGKAGGGLPPGSEVCEEVALSEPGSPAAAWIYPCFMSRPGPLSDKKYITPKNEQEVEGAGYVVGFSDDNLVSFNRLQVKGAGGLLPDAVDRMKLGIEVNVLLGVTEYLLNDGDWKHYLRGVRAGPIRVIKEFESVLESWGGMQQRTYSHVYFYPYHIEYDLKARAVGYWGKGLHRSNLVVAIDLDEGGRGMKFYSEKNPRGETVDGMTRPSEINMNYGPTKWSAVSGASGTIMVHLALDPRAKLQADLYYDDNDDKGDPPEDNPGMLGKFGYIVHHLEKSGYGYDPFPFRWVVYVTDQPYQPGLEKNLTGLTMEPLQIKVQRHEFRGLPQSAPPPDTRAEPPTSPYAERRGSLQYRFLAPSFIIDPNLLGVGPGVSYYDMDFLGTGTTMGFLALWTDRGYASYSMNFSELRFLPGVEAFEINLSNDSFPAEPYYGRGNDSPKDHKALFWWHSQQAWLRFNNYFGGVYGVELRVGYKTVDIDSGIQPAGGDHLPSVEEHYGRDRELRGERWGPPVFGWEGGNMSGFNLAFFRDMRDARNLPKFGNYQRLDLYVVTSLLGADYDYARATLDLRWYWHPDFLNPIPGLDTRISPRRTLLGKFFGTDKNRALAARVVFTRTFADKIDWFGEQILEVPFYDLPYLGSGNNLKAFASRRFRDNDMVFLSFEYRWRWWKFEDIALYYDLGIVMDDLLVRQNWEGTWHSSYGFSYRIHVPPNIIITFEWGWSEEEAFYMNQMNWGF